MKCWVGVLQGRDRAILDFAKLSVVLWPEAMRTHNATTLRSWGGWVCVCVGGSGEENI